MTLGRGVELVDRLGGGAHGRVEPEGHHGPHHVVVDRLRHADHREPLLPEVVADLERPVTTDGDEGLEPARIERRDQVVRAVHLALGPVRPRFAPAERIAAIGGAEDGPAEVGDAADAVGIELDDPGIVRPKQAVEAALDAIGLPPTLVGGEHDGADHGVEAGSIAAAGRESESHVSIYDTTAGR